MELDNPKYLAHDVTSDSEGTEREGFFDSARRKLLERNYLIAVGALILVTIVFALAIYFYVAGRKDDSPSTILDDSLQTVIVISLDGFRYDYLDKADASNIQSIIKRGFRADRMDPVFPSLTFPNHYGQVTGLYAESNGIVGNTMYDPILDKWFSISGPEVTNDTWWLGEPIWITAQKWGYKSGIYFWPGSEAPHHGVYPTYYEKYNTSVPNDVRVKQVLAWLDLPLEDRPNLIQLYFSDVDTAGHNYGPDSPEVVQSIISVDGSIGQLLAGLQDRGILEKVNIIIVSDHGMTAVSQNRTIPIQNYITLSSVNVVTYGPVMMLIPRDESQTDELIFNLTNPGHPNLTVWHKSEIPAEYHFENNARITPIVGLVDEGWTVTSPNYTLYSRGNHGFDPAIATMGAFFAAAGPRYKQSDTGFNPRAIDIYNLLCWTLSVAPAPNNGSLDAFIPYLKLVG